MRKSIWILLLAMWCLQSCTTGGGKITRTDVTPARPLPLGLSNREYAQKLSQDGWPVDLLNTAARASYLNDEEKNLVLAMNLIRHNPGLYADLYVSQYIGYFSGKLLNYPGRISILTQEGVAPARELYQELKKAKPSELFFPSQKLSLAARSHALYQSRTGQTGHGGQGGMRARIEREGKWRGSIGENIAYGNWSAHDAIMGLMIDDGVPDRGHRKNMLNSSFRVVGVAIAPHPKFDGGVYVINYAVGFEDVD